MLLLTHGAIIKGHCPYSVILIYTDEPLNAEQILCANGNLFHAKILIGMITL